MLTDVAIVEEVLRAHAGPLGRDATGYRNHVYRVVNLCVGLRRDVSPEEIEKIAIAGVFHDLGIWTHCTFDYLPPSVELAREYLARTGRVAWRPEIEQTILNHHKLSRAAAAAADIVEAFRRADWIDVTRGVRTFGVPRAAIKEVQAAFPSAGFHRRLVELSLQRLRTHPLSPLPMLRF